MTTKTDIAALREKFESVFDGNKERNPYHPDIYNAYPTRAAWKYYQLGNELLRSQLKAEHLRAETLSKSEWKMAGELGELIQRAEKAEAELAELKVDQVPVAHVSDDDYQEIYWTKHGQERNVGYGSPLYATPQKPVSPELITRLIAVMNDWSKYNESVIYRPEFTDVMMLLEDALSANSLKSTSKLEPKYWAVVSGYQTRLCFSEKDARQLIHDNGGLFIERLAVVGVPERLSGIVGTGG